MYVLCIMYYVCMYYVLCIMRLAQLWREGDIRCMLDYQCATAVEVELALWSNTNTALISQTILKCVVLALTPVEECSKSSSTASATGDRCWEGLGAAWLHYG